MKKNVENNISKKAKMQKNACGAYVGQKTACKNFKKGMWAPHCGVYVHF